MAYQSKREPKLNSRRSKPAS